jgi:hypothetical protein
METDNTSTDHDATGVESGALHDGEIRFLACEGFEESRKLAAFMDWMLLDVQSKFGCPP